jgi:hypothetical protein
MKRKNTLAFFLLALLLVIASCQSEEPNSPLSAALSELSGTVDMKQAGQETFAPASSDSQLEVDGQVQTGDDGRVRLDLSSGTIIRVGPSSLFTLLSNDEVEGGLATKIKLEIGKIFIILNGGSADVETPSGVASVRGSYMKVEVDPVTLDIYVTCLEGNCSASNPAGAVNFTNGEKVVLFHRDPDTGNWIAPTVEPMTPEEFQEWLDNNPEARELYEQAMATITALAQPTATGTPIPSPAPTETLQSSAPSDTTTGGGCFNIIQPQSGESLPKQGRVTFEWEEQPGAQLYIMTFIDQNGNRAIIETTDTSTERFIEVLPAGGQYSWFVTAYGSNGSEICSTSPVTFTKPQGDPTPRPTREPEPEPPQPTEEPTEEPVDCELDPYNPEC